MPKQEIEELVLHNTRNENDEWVGEQFHKGCWIYMQPAAIGPHRVRRRGVLDQHWKGRLLGFKTKKVEGMVAIVQHVYCLSDIHLCSEGERRASLQIVRSKVTLFIFLKIYVHLLILPFFHVDIFPSTLIEEQPLRSLSGTFLALHATIGKVVLDGRTPSDLAQGRIFFYSHTYIIPRHDGGYGKLEPIPSPSLQSSEWPKPDVWSVMALKHKIVSDIHASLKFGKASRSVGLSWCCPIHVFVHMFCTFPFTQAPTMFVCKEVDHEALDFLLGDKWDSVEGMHDGDIYRCNIAHSRISLRYLKLRTTLYIRFHYERWMKKRSKWIPL